LGNPCYTDVVTTARRLAIAAIILYLSWLGMLATHELGHVIHAQLSGGHTIAISFPLAGFSQTFVDPNPHPQFVAWGGPLWGVAIPSLLVATLKIIRRRVPSILWFFAGFCLIPNGAYIGLGWMKRSGDAHDLVRDGAPLFTLILFGVVCFVAGLLFWHQIPSERWRRL
jgi:hypothetical protein